MSDVVYTKWHNNYPFDLGEKYVSSFYKEGWLLIDGQLYRSDCFQQIKTEGETV